MTSPSALRTLEEIFRARLDEAHARYHAASMAYERESKRGAGADRLAALADAYRAARSEYAAGIQEFSEFYRRRLRGKRRAE